jgi:thiol-disulfide isomerase/thioredoxin
MIRRMKTCLILLFLMMVPLSPLNAGPGAAPKKLWADSFIGKSAVDFSVESWLSEKPERAGKMVLIDFWATWCGPCRKAIPHMNTFHQKYKDRLVVIGVSDEPAKQVKAFEQPAVHYYSAIDTQARMKKAYGVRGIPHVVIIDPKGIVRWEGYPFLSGHELTEAVVGDLLDEYVPAKKD